MEPLSYDRDVRLGGRVKLAIRTMMDRDLFFVPPGHFYSPIAGVRERHNAVISGPTPRELGGIDLGEDAQLRLLHDMLPHYAELPFSAPRQAGMRYGYDNIQYTYSDAIFYFLVLVHLRPQRVVEVGSGHSSALALDVNERFLEGRCQLTFVEPFPRTLRMLVPESEVRGRLIAQPVQSVSLSIFKALGPGDVLFIDSTHVCRAGSDVNFLLFEVLPALREGVLIHVHDIFHPFEYPREWIREGRAWNEAYVLRAFLQFNTAFRILLFNSFLEIFHRPWFAEHMPLCLDPPIPTGSIWLEKVA